MGFFPKYDKPGPGIDKDEDSKKGPFSLFFQIYFEKFSRLCTMNLLFILFNIPSMILAYLTAVYFLPMINPVFAPDAFTQKLSELGIAETAEAALPAYLLILSLAVIFAVGMLLISLGPVQAGLSYLYRNFARRQPTFLWQDFKSAVKSNWKQSWAASAIAFVLTVVFLFNIVFYSNVLEGTGKMILIASFLFAFIILMCVQIFIYPMIASVELPLKNILKNSLLLFMGRFLPTLGIFFADVGVIFAIPLLILAFLPNFGLPFISIYYLLFAFSFVHFLNTFFAWRQIERYIALPQDNGTDAYSNSSES